MGPGSSQRGADGGDNDPESPEPWPLPTSAPCGLQLGLCTQIPKSRCHASQMGHSCQTWERGEDGRALRMQAHRASGSSLDVGDRPPQILTLNALGMLWGEISTAGTSEREENNPHLRRVCWSLYVSARPGSSPQLLGQTRGWVLLRMHLSMWFLLQSVNSSERGRLHHVGGCHPIS